jgi:hypothetical protein
MSSRSASSANDLGCAAPVRIDRCPRAGQYAAGAGMPVPPHDRGIMPKLLTMGPLIAAALLSLGVLGVIVGWAAPSGGGGVFGNFTWLDQDDVGRRQRELLFLKAAFDRLEVEAQQEPSGPATPSLRAEQQAVLAHMREVARPLPADAVPGDLRAFVKGEAPPAPQAVVVLRQPAEPTDSATVARELQVGLNQPSPAIELGVSRDPGLGVIVLVARPRPRPVLADGSAEAQSAAADGRPAAKPRAVEKPTTSPQPPDIIGRTEANRAAAAAAALR